MAFMAAKRSEPYQGSNLLMEAVPSMKRCRARLRGIVQGVGFRPYVFQLAEAHRLNGWVRNDTDGVELEVAGTGVNIEGFLRDLPARTPPLARVVELEVHELPFEPMESFHILPSRGDRPRRALISPDTCVCEDCLRELRDPDDRRYRYPFINCTNCGPRYTIVRDVPYDRHRTTMASFSMCPACRKEYEDPSDRRFHAQPNACWDCGPQAWLEDAGGKVLAQGDEALREVPRLLARGAVVAVKGLGGFHLAADATREEVVSRLRRRKIREEKPFAVMFAGLEDVRDYCKVNEQEEGLLRSASRPIVLLERRPVHAGPPLAPGLAPRNRFLGAFLPYTPLHVLLMDGIRCRALVMTSGNQSDEPIVADNEEARERLKHIADHFLFHDRDIHMRCDDSVACVIRSVPRLLRRARGYAPAPVFLASPAEAVLGTGAGLKNTVCLTRDREAFVSQHIGDLENIETLRSFERTVQHLRKILEIRPRLVAHDLHPDYLSTQWASRQDRLPTLAVQHHHAHIASVVAERGLAGPVLGLALDGAGYGTDGTFWGGEILRVDGERMDRLGHLRPVPLPGGDGAVREPWRMALSYLWTLAPGRTESLYGDFLERWPAEKVSVLLQMLEKGINCPRTSSCGRLFDGVAALAGIRTRITHEGQAAMEWEQALAPAEGAYEGDVRQEEGEWIMDPLPIVNELVEDIRKGTLTGVLSARFHRGLERLLVRATKRAGEQTGLRRVALSGGVLQNRCLSRSLEAALEAAGFQVHTHREIPPNDACISLGQAHVGSLYLQRMARENP